MLIGLSLPVSFAASPSDVPVRSASINLPRCGYWQENSRYYYGCVWPVYNQSDGSYVIYYSVLSSGSQFNITSFTPAVYPYRIPTLYFSGSVTRYEIDEFNLDGTLLGHHDLSSSGIYSNYVLLGGDMGDNVVPYQTGLFFFEDGVNTFPINDYKGYGSIFGGYATDHQFISFSTAPFADPEVIRSHLSEPVADCYNRYVILNDKLYWFSIRDVSFQTATYSAREYQTVPSVEVYTGVDSQGVQYAIIGGSTYTVPAQFGSIFAGDPDNIFDLSLYCEDGNFYLTYGYNSSFASLAQQLYCVCNLFVSEFDVVTGEYSRSSNYIFSFDGSFAVHQQFFDVSVDDISSVKFYGVNYLYNDVDFHLASIVWGVDPVVENWRDSMLDRLEQIYNLLSQSSDVPETTTSRDFAGELGSADPGAGLNAGDAGGKFNEAVSSLNNLSGAGDTVKGWINGFLPPKLMFLVGFVIAFGIVIMILGKNKND